MKEFTYIVLILISSCFVSGCQTTTDAPIVIEESTVLGFRISSNIPEGAQVLLGYSSSESVYMHEMTDGAEQTPVLAIFGATGEQFDNLIVPNVVAVGDAAVSYANTLASTMATTYQQGVNTHASRYSFIEMEGEYYVLDQKSGILYLVVTEKNGNFDLNREVGEVGRKYESN